jgi:hypothetical protein
MQKLQLCAAALALVACAADSDDLGAAARPGKGHGGSPSTIPDAAVSTPTDPAGTVSCYSEGAPQTTCTLPTHCCFSNYSAQHNGYCTTSQCAWGTIDCDGPEDCASGQYCCGHKSEYGGWTLACSATACGAPELNEELCHTSETCGGRTCVGAYGVAYDFPRTLSVCR